MIKTKVEKFDEFFVRDGELMGRACGETYRLKDIIYNGKGQTYVTYYDGEEEVRMLQYDSKGFVNRRVYG